MNTFESSEPAPRSFCNVGDFGTDPATGRPLTLDGDVMEPDADLDAAEAESSGHSTGPWKAHDDDGTGTLPCVLSDKVTPFGNFYVAQCNRFEDAVLCAAAPEMADALEALRTHPVVAGLSARIRDDSRRVGITNPLDLADAALRKAGRS